ARILLLLLIRRHWALHKEALLAAFPQAGPLEPQLRSQAELLEKEGDGARKALALHGLLKLMIGAPPTPPPWPHATAQHGVGATWMVAAGRGGCLLRVLG
ncbi:hypothetical protein HaLaN_19507, partial [Haematococcus lacustris]